MHKWLWLKQSALLANSQLIKESFNTMKVYLENV